MQRSVDEEGIQSCRETALAEIAMTKKSLEVLGGDSICGDFDDEEPVSCIIFIVIAISANAVSRQL